MHPDLPEAFTMRRYRSACALLLALLTFTAQSRTLTEVRAGDGRLMMATEGQFAPFNFFKGTQLTGFEVELADKLVGKLGLKSEWKAMGFDALLTGLNQNRWDLVIASHAITDERAKAVSFAAPHYCSGGVIVSRDPAIRTARDLAGKTVAVQTGTTYLENVKKVAGVKEVKNFPQDSDARSALATGRVDVWVTDRFMAIESLKAAPAANLKIGDYLFVERIAAAFAKGNTSLVTAWNQALAEAMADGSYAALSKKYFGEDVRCK
jgi:polar amino acid transport system substrate-binding protein